MYGDYRKVSVRSAAALTTAYVAGTVINEDNSGLNPRDFNQMAIRPRITLGSLTSVQIKVEFSEDGSNYHQETFSSISGGTSTESLGEHSFAASGNFEIKVPIQTNNIKISVKGTGTTTASSCAIEAILKAE